MRHAIVHIHHWKGSKENSFILGVYDSREEAEGKLPEWEQARAKARSNMEEAAALAGLDKSNATNGFVDRLEIREAGDDAFVNTKERDHVLLLSKISPEDLAQVFKLACGRG